MQFTSGRLVEMRLEGNGSLAARIGCPARVTPSPGQYLMAWAPADGEAALAEPLFAAQPTVDGFWAAPAAPRAWEPGMELQLRGPLGRGFKLAGSVRRLALAALGDTASRLLPLLYQALEADLEVTLYASCPLPPLPAALEITPLGALPESLPWADFLALDLPRESLPGLRRQLGLPPGFPLPCPAQALLLASMPCGALAGCGACAVPARGKPLLACVDGPVFDLGELEW